MERYSARNSALEELKNLLMPMILDELNMSQGSEMMPEEKEPMENESMMKDMADQIADNMEDEEEIKKPGISLSITELGMAKPKGKPVMQKKRSAKKRRR